MDSIRGYLNGMEKSPKVGKENSGEKKDNEAVKNKLSKPPKDKREVIIGPTTSTGPDITVT